MTLFDSQLLANLLTLTVLEIVLGIDNLVFISIVSSDLPMKQQAFARRLGLFFAMLTRLLLLASVVWIAGLTQPVLSMLGYDFSGRDLLFIGGGLFLLYKGTQELRHCMRDQHAQTQSAKLRSQFFLVVVEIMFFDIIFSLDSVITAVGLSQVYWVMATAIIIAIIVMLVASEPLSRCIQTYPSIKILALSFLLLIGVVLIADGLDQHVPRAYLYFAVGFSIFVETLNIISQKRVSKS